MSIPTISADALRELWKSGRAIELIDVRTPTEFQEAHVEFARNIPLDQLGRQALVIDDHGRSADALYVVCRSGGRGRQACEKLLEAGRGNVVNVEGGTLACEQSGLPMVRGRKVVSLERQVRIAAGALVLLGALLGWLVHPLFAGLSVFVGGGLIFAGITDTCGLALLLARMPWNRLTDSMAPRCER